MLSKIVKSQVFNAIVTSPSFLGKYEEHDGIFNDNACAYKIQQGSESFV